MSPETLERLIAAMAEASSLERLGTYIPLGRPAAIVALDAILADPDITLVEGGTVEWVVRSGGQGTWQEHRHAGPWEATTTNETSTDE